MADVEDLKIVLRAEVDKAVADLKKGAAAGRSASKDWDGIAKSFTKSAKESLSVKNAFGQLTTQVAGGMAIYALATRTVQGFVNFGKESIASYEAQEQAVAKLNAVLAATGGAVGLSTWELQSYASELQSMTTVGDESIIEMQGVLATFNDIQGETFKEATARVLDLSARFGTDLTSTAKQLGKALEDPIQGVSGLSKAGVTFTAAEKKMMASMVEAGNKAGAQAIILDKLEKKVGGVAAAMAGNGSGAAKQFANAWDDSKELLGQAITETLEPAYRLLTKFVTATNEAISAKLNLDAVSKSGGEKGDTAAAVKTLDAQIVKLEGRLAKAQNLLDHSNKLVRQGMLGDTYEVSAMVADLERQLKPLKERRDQLLAVKKVADEKAASDKKAADAAKAASEAEAARAAADAAALAHYGEVDAALQKKLDTMYLEASLTGEMISLEDLRNAYQEAWIKLIVDSNGKISESNALTFAYKGMVLQLNDAIAKAPQKANYSVLGDMSDVERLYQLYSQTHTGIKGAKEETIAWVEAQRALAEAAGENLDLFDEILDDLHGVEDTAEDSKGWSLFPDDSLHNITVELEDLKENLLGIFDAAALAEGMTDAFASMGEALAEDSDVGDALGQSLQRAGAMMLRQASTFAMTAGLRVLAEGGLASLPLALGLFALGGITGILSGFLGSGGGSYAAELTYDPILQAEKELRDQRLELLRETIAEEKKLRQAAIDKLGETFDAEYEVLRDLWDRNIISTSEFASRSGALRSSRDTAIEEANQPTPAEQEAAKQEEETKAMESLRQNLYARLKKGMDLINAIDPGSNIIAKATKSAYKSALATMGNKIPPATTLQELNDIGTGFTNISEALSKYSKIPRFGMGGDFVTSGPQMIMVGDNPGGRERVTVEPISSPNLHGPSGGVTFNIIGPIYGIDDLRARIDESERIAARRGRTRTGVFN